MYTRYSGIEVPQNYSGNRFRKKIVEDTETKVHTNVTSSAVKSSVSPSFEDQLKGGFYQENTEEANQYFPEIVDNVAENDSLDSVSEVESNSDKANGRGLLSELNLSPIIEYLKGITGEDLLLIALIIFLASEKSISNNDIIILLALLLVYA